MIPNKTYQLCIYFFDRYSSCSKFYKLKSEDYSIELTAEEINSENRYCFDDFTCHVFIIFYIFSVDIQFIILCRLFIKEIIISVSHLLLMLIKVQFLMSIFVTFFFCIALYHLYFVFVIYRHIPWLNKGFLFVFFFLFIN